MLLRTILRFDRTQLAPGMAGRNALGVLLALAAGILLHNPTGGLLAAIGALDAAFSDGSDPYPRRARRMLAATFFVALAVFAGRWHGGIEMEAVCAFVAGMLVAIGDTPGNIGNITLVTLIVFSAQPAPFEKAAVSGLLAAAGGILQTLLSVALWPVRRFHPEAQALSALYADLAEIAISGARASQPPPATASVLAARQALEGAARTIESERYLALFSQAERIRLGLLALSRMRAPGRVMELAANMLSSIAGSLAAGVKGDPHPECLSELHQVAHEMEKNPETFRLSPYLRSQVEALAGQLGIATELAAHATIAGEEEFRRREATQPWQLRLAGALAVLRANLNLRSAVFRHAIRLAACVTIADILARSLHWNRAYWAPMTAAIVLKPEFTNTLTRGVLRLVGTFLGLAFATALFAALTPSLWMQIALITVFMFVMRWAGGANYGLLVVPLTGLVVLLFALSGVSPGEVAAARALNTAAGGLIALTANRLWPTWERTRINDALAHLLDSYRDYFRVVADGYLDGGVDRPRLDGVRQAGRLARSNLEASAERYRIEPGAEADRVTALQAILANSHRLIHAMMALEAGLYRTTAAPPREEFRVFANHVDTTLYFLAAYLRGTAGEPGDLPDLREAHRALTEGGDPHIARYAVVNLETDRITNSLNTLAIEVIQWVAADGAAM